MKAVDNYFLQLEEPHKSCLLSLRALILKSDGHITEAWKYGMPFYCYSGKICCYLWVHKKLRQPYLGIVEGKKINHPQLLSEKRSRMKIFLIHPDKDIPVNTIKNLLSKVMKLYQG